MPSRQLLPGLVIAATGAIGAVLLDGIIKHTTGFSSTILWAIILGIAVGNIRIPASASPGLGFAAKHVLRAGIVLLGLEISLHTIMALGPMTLLLIVAIVASGIAASYLLAKPFGLPREHAILIGSGCSICGAAAISAVEGVLPKRTAEQIASAIAVIVVLGSLMIFGGPALVHALGFADYPAGVFIGGATHEVGQVVAAGGIASAAVLPIAVAVKLGRVVMLAPVVAVVGYADRPSLRGLIPGFVWAFLAAVILRTFLPLPQELITTTTTARTWLFAAAMFALGTTVTVSALRKAGMKPFLFGLMVSAVVAAVALAGAFLAS